VCIMLGQPTAREFCHTRLPLVPGNSWGLAELPDRSQLDEVPGIMGGQLDSPSLLPVAQK